VALILAEGALLVWIAGPGLHALSPHFANSRILPPWPTTVIVVYLVLLFATWFAFRLTSKPSQSILPAGTPQLASPPEDRFFHEQFSGALVVGLVASGGIVYQLISFRQLPFVPDWEDMLYLLILPDSLVMFATAIWGFALAWTRIRSASQARPLPTVDIYQFATVQFAIATAIALGGPLIAAFTFALMLFGFGMTR
jgi:hypothetical protein